MATSRLKSDGLMLRRLSRPARHAALYALLIALTALVQRLPLTWAQRLGEHVGSLIGRVTALCSPKSHRALHRRLSHLSAYGPDEREELAAECWRDLGRRAFEWLSAERALPLVELSPKVEAWCHELKGSGRHPVWLCLSAHYGHWELMAAQLAAEGLRFTAAASRERNGPVGRWITRRRAKLGVQTMRPGQALKSLRSLRREGGVRALLIDQAPSGASGRRPLMFLGEEAPTATLPSRLIERCRAGGETRVVWLYSAREGDGRYCVYGEDLSAEEDPVRAATQLLEELILRDPTQWLWLNERWGAAPEERLA